MTIRHRSGKVAHTSATTKVRKFPSLGRVMAYNNNAVVTRIAQELSISETQAVSLFKDTLKFLWLAGKFGRVVPSTRIDEGWHTFILFTMDYQKFCHKYFGYFLHHRPRRPEDKPDGGELRNRTHALIAEHLGDNLGENWNYHQLGKGDCDQSCAPSRIAMVEMPARNSPQQIISAHTLNSL